MVGRAGAAHPDEEAWGPPLPSDIEGTYWAPTSVPPRTAPVKPLNSPGRGVLPCSARSSRQQQHEIHQHLKPAGLLRSEAKQTGPDSLHAICLGVLGEHLKEMLSDRVCAEFVLPLLPAEVKSCLLAVARLRCLLCDAALLLLADQGQTILDLHGCGGLLSDSGIRQALQQLPDLREADLTSCPVSADTLRTLGQACPKLQVLRLGSVVTDASAGRGLKVILPVLQQRHAAPAVDSWDALLDVESDAQALSAAVAGSGRLMHLQSITWPNIQHRLAEYCREVCPKVALNPTAEQVAKRLLPRACDAAVQLDAPLLAEVSNSQRWEQEDAVLPPKPIVHIAEKFRMAYISRHERIKAKMERNWQQQRRRELQRSPAEALIRQWESEL